MSLTATKSVGQATAIITGAGSGVGRAAALRLVREGWRVGLLGRRADALAETRAMAAPHGDQVILQPCDIGDRDQAAGAMAALIQALGRVDALVNAAGTNAPRRSLAEVDVATYEQLINTNLNGAFYAIHAVLPVMRRQGGGTIVNIISDAGLLANAKAGPGYVASKFGLTGLTQSINVEERGNGIRATAIFPGDINTPLLDKRPAPPPMDARARMLQPDDVVECMMLALKLPENAIVEQLVIRPR